MPTLRIPTPLRPMAGGHDEIEVAGATVAEVLDRLAKDHPDLHGRICDGDGGLRRFINLYVGEEDIRGLDGLDTPVAADAVISVVPAIAGGAGTTWNSWLAELRKTYPEVEPKVVAEETESDRKPVLLDVRESDEFRQGFVPGAIHLPRGFLELRAEQTVPDREAPIVTYCAGGVRSLLAAESLRKLGYANVRSMRGGFKGWREAELPVETQVGLTDAERRRYSRHLSIPEVGEKGQAKLKEAKVLLVGAGGLGCPAAIYLAAAGVGTLGLVDFDVVDESNLQRQILHPTDRVGTSKVESAQATLRAMNPLVTVNGIEARLTSGNVRAILEPYDIIIDGSDNFPTRYLVNDACVLLKKPCVHGSVYRFEGQVSVFDPARGGPCYRCLYPEPPPPELAPSCADAGVLGVLPGVIGLLEAVETIKLILGVGDPLLGRLLTYDALAPRFGTLKLRRDPDCAYCAPGKPFPGFIDYETFCVPSSARAAGSGA